MLTLALGSAAEGGIRHHAVIATWLPAETSSRQDHLSSTPSPAPPHGSLRHAGPYHGTDKYGIIIDSREQHVYLGTRISQQQKQTWPYRKRRGYLVFGIKCCIEHDQKSSNIPCLALNPLTSTHSTRLTPHHHRRSCHSATLFPPLHPPCLSACTVRPQNCPPF